MENKLVINLHKNQISNEQSQNQDFHVPPRCERMFKVEVDIPNGDYLVQQGYHDDCLFNPNCLIHVSNKSAYLPLLNANTLQISQPEIGLTLERIEDKLCLKISKETPPDHILSRIDTLKTHLRLSHLNPEEKNAVYSTCEKYVDIFNIGSEPLTMTDSVKHTIPLKPDSIPVKVRPYRLPYSQREEVEKQVTSMLEQATARGTPLYLLFPKRLPLQARRNSDSLLISENFVQYC